jgi:hypothetical protein
LPSGPEAKGENPSSSPYDKRGIEGDFNSGLKKLSNGLTIREIIQ